MTSKPSLVCTLLLTFWLQLAWSNTVQFPRPAEVGPEWQGGTGVVIEDLQNPPDFYARSMTKVLAKYRVIGVKSMANLACRRKTNLLHQVELKLFEFESVEQAQAWQLKKYGYDGWQQHYQKTVQGDMVIFDSTEISKRIVFFDTHWITASVLGESEDHLLFMNQAIKLIRPTDEN